MSTAAPAVRARLARHLDALALAQLREVAAAQSEELDALRAENEHLRRAYYDASHDADMWRKDAIAMQLELCERTHRAPGITPTGHLVTIPRVAMPA